jgi:uncharacterized protein (DUF302 family)
MPFILIFAVVVTAGCGDQVPLGAERYASSDALFFQMDGNLSSSETLQKVTEIDHSRLGVKAGSTMPPARVLVFSNPALETELIGSNPLIALDLPLRILAYETEPEAPASVIYKSSDYLASRYGAITSRQKSLYQDSIATVLNGIPAEQIAAFPNNELQPNGIITISSPYDFATTLVRVQAAIDAQDDTVSFGTIDFQSQARALNKTIPPATMILFGGPAPGAKAMSSGPTLGLDAFCQKFLIWQDENQQVYLSFNDLLILAERHGVSKSLTLRVINYRLNKTFTEALAR